MAVFISCFFAVFPESKPFEATDCKTVSTSNHNSKNNEVSVTFMLSSAAAKVGRRSLALSLRTRL